jgi:plasmid segregation protein ParM
MTQKICLGLDVGRSSVKVAAASSKGERHLLSFPSAYTPAFAMADASAMAKAAAETVTVHGQSYFVGDTAIIQGRDDLISGLSDDWTTQHGHGALVLSGLKRLEDRGMRELNDALIVVGLPARLYSSQRKAYQEAISALLPRAEIKVVPQSMGPFYTMLFDERGESQEGYDDSSWGFVEVGQFTTDFAMVDRGHVVDRAFDSCDGMRLAAENLQRLVQQRFSVTISLNEATSMLAEPQLRSFGRMIDVSELVKEASMGLAASIASKAAQVFGDSVRSLSGIRVAGGGAPLVRDALASRWSGPDGAGIPEDFVAVVPNARYAVAEGFLRFALGLHRHRSAVAA